MEKKAAPHSSSRKGLSRLCGMCSHIPSLRHFCVRALQQPQPPQHVYPDPQLASVQHVEPLLQHVALPPASSEGQQVGMATGQYDVLSPPQHTVSTGAHTSEPQHFAQQRPAQHWSRERSHEASDPPRTSTSPKPSTSTVYSTRLTTAAAAENGPTLGSPPLTHSVAFVRQFMEQIASLGQQRFAPQHFVWAGQQKSMLPSFRKQQTSLQNSPLAPAHGTASAKLHRRPAATQSAA